MDADKALDLIRSNDRVVIGHACGEPSYLVDTLVKKLPSMRTWKSSIWYPWERLYMYSLAWNGIFITMLCSQAAQPETPLRRDVPTTHPAFLPGTFPLCRRNAPGGRGTGTGVTSG